MTATMLVTPIAEMEIGNVRVRWRGTLAADATMLRLRVDHLLGTADLQPAGMPPAAVLIVRRFTRSEGRVADREARGP